MGGVNQRELFTGSLFSYLLSWIVHSSLFLPSSNWFFHLILGGKNSLLLSLLVYLSACSLSVDVFLSFGGTWNLFFFSFGSSVWLWMKLLSFPKSQKTKKKSLFYAKISLGLILRFLGFWVSGFLSVSSNFVHLLLLFLVWLMVLPFFFLKKNIIFTHSTYLC